MMKMVKRCFNGEVDNWNYNGVDYEGLLKKLRSSEKKASSISEKTPLLRSANVNEDFFSLCDRELHKIDHFYTGKLSESLVELSRLDSRLESFESTPLEQISSNEKYDAVHRIPAAEVDRISSSSATIFDAERLAQDLIKLHTQLVFLLRYQQNNTDAFQAILRRHDKMRNTDQGFLWFFTHVKQTSFSNLDRVSELIEIVQTMYTERCANGDRLKAISLLHVARDFDKDSHWTGVRIGAFCGVFLVSILFSALCAWLEMSNHYTDWRAALQLFRGSSLVILFVALIGANFHGWNVAGIRHVLLLELDPRHHLQPKHFVEIASALAAVWIVTLIFYLVGHRFDIPSFIGPLLVVSCFLVFLLNPFQCLYYRARRWFLSVLVRILVAPFCHVEFVDFWMADQFNSLATVFLDAEYLVCFYLVDVNWSRDSGVKSDACTDLVWRGFASCLPAWFRLAQCLRFYYETHLEFPHLVNAGKYASTIVATTFSIFHSYSRQTVNNSSDETFTSTRRIQQWMLLMWLVTSMINACYTSLWDILMDWRLFVTDTTGGHVNNVFGRQLLFKRPIYYWAAIVQNVVLRFTWAIAIACSEQGHVTFEAVKTTLAVLEVYRRFVWNFFRLEVEQLNYDADRNLRTLKIEITVEPDDSRSRQRHQLTLADPHLATDSCLQSSATPTNWSPGAKLRQTVIYKASADKTSGSITSPPRLESFPSLTSQLKPKLRLQSLNLKEMHVVHKKQSTTHTKIPPLVDESLTKTSQLSALDRNSTVQGA